MDNATGLPRRGHTWFEGSTAPSTYGGTTNLEGQLVRFRDFDPSTGVDSSFEARTGRFTVCRLVRNTSGITLQPKRVVKYASGHLYKRVDGYCAVNHEACAGVVDDYLTNGIPNNDLGWIVVGGPCLVKTDLAGGANNSIAAGAVLAALTAATSQATTAGRIKPLAGTWSATETTDGTAFDQIFNYLGKAISAKTTANTNADILVNLEIVKMA